ncbi:ribose-5-phosphate isomerase RpiA [Pikeienuella piscinae]|uniref:Ribose-5-phosphate isomerase A n=1 Tax=Pikeienuella piscinae TaxID=2748098 RepID=A0A7L5BSR9_9RHOB|nr:ribose-5-phosphate isomerase RpiA [Pikeienuella piscinae]QIE54315.1 ribose-5-phosphate isomerase RpiA [Pikeienuella piscinae]
MQEPTTPAERAKFAAARRALDYVEPGMRLGLGTGSTAVFLVRLLGERMADRDLLCVPTSSRTAALATECGLNVRALEDVDALDLTIDGADEFDPGLTLIKGGGGSLLQEKIVAAASARMVVIADESKAVSRLGAFPLPVEVVRFGWRSTMRHIERLLATEDVDGRGVRRRTAGDEPFVTDEGHFILDLDLGRIGDAPGLARRLDSLPGVVETGLFLGLADAAIVGREDGGVDFVERVSGDRT